MCPLCMANLATGWELIAGEIDRSIRRPPSSAALSRTGVCGTESLGEQHQTYKGLDRRPSGTTGSMSCGDAVAANTLDNHPSYTSHPQSTAPWTSAPPPPPIHRWPPLGLPTNRAVLKRRNTLLPRYGVGRKGVKAFP
jgi:hypothetical protein